jgi:8-oxo-dGTP pyrophosphatase MutT (NUDIX family)
MIQLPQLTIASSSRGHTQTVTATQPDYFAITRHLMDIYEPARLDQPNLSRAAVLLPLYEFEGEQCVLVTKRTDFVEHHKGEISFPGGAMDDCDETIEACALREVEEELGVDPQHVEIIGALDDIVTISNFHVTPLIGVITESPYAFTLHEHEVAEVIELPISWLLDPDNLVEEPRERDGLRYVNYIYRYDGNEVWGATGRILHQYIELLRAGLEIDFEQPVVDLKLPADAQGYS